MIRMRMGSMITRMNAPMYQALIKTRVAHLIEMVMVSLILATDARMRLVTPTIMAARSPMLTKMVYQMRPTNAQRLQATLLTVVVPLGRDNLSGILEGRNIFRPHFLGIFYICLA
jgi:hypothetical protein